MDSESRSNSFVIVLLIGLISGLFFAGWLSNKNWKRDCIDAKVGQYNPTNGHFEFKKIE